MFTTRGQIAVLLLLPLAVPAAWASDAAGTFENASPIKPVSIDYYFEPGCDECVRVDSLVLPVLEAGYAGFYKLNRLDLSVEANYLRLVDTLDLLGGGRNEYVFMVIGNNRLLQGYAEISERLIDVVGESLACADRDPAPRVPEATRERAGAKALMAERARGFTIAAVVVAGILDGVNPCAVSILVFFISLLAVSRISGRRLLLSGTAFCLASFLTYIAIGFGLLRAIRLIFVSPAVQTAVESGMCMALLVLAFLSFRDAARYSAGRNPADISLQLPSKLKMRIHAMMRNRMRSGSLILAAFIIGVAATLMDSICTGQVYLPTLVFIAKGGPGRARALGYLLLYNVAFILPLVVVFIVTYRGLKIRKLMEWSSKNVVVSKTLLGLFFITMALLIIVM